MLTNQRYELTTAVLLDLLTGLTLNHPHQLLRLALADRNHQAPAEFQLRDQWFGDARTTGSYQDCFVRTVSAPTQGSVKRLHRGVVDTQLANARLRFARQFAQAFDSVNLRTQARQNRGLITRACTNLKHAALLINLQQLSHARHDKRLRNCLIKIYRQGIVVIRAPRNASVTKK